MAIKGKRRPKGGSRTITLGPKPTYVPVRPPLLARRSFWTTLGAVALVLVLAGVWYGVARERAQAREAELARRLRNAALELRAEIDPILAPLGTPTPPSGFVAFPDLRTALDDAADGKGASSELAGVAEAVAERAERAADDLEAVDAAGILSGKGFDMSVVLNAVNARARMVQGLRLYHQAALLAADAAEGEGELAMELATRAKEVFDLAGRVFSDGYHDYVEVQLAADVFQPVPPAG